MTATTVKKGFDAGYIRNLVIGFSFMFLFRYIPPAEPITVVGMQVIGIFIGTIFLIATVHPAWPSFLAAVLLASTPLYSANDVISQTMGNWLPNFLLAIFVLGYALIQSGITKRFTLWLITRPVVNGRPWLFTIFFLGSILIIGSLMDGMALIAFYLAATTLICTQLGYEKGDPYPTGLILGVGFMISIVGASTGFQANIAFVFGQYAGKSGGLIIDFLRYSVWAGVLIGLLFVLYMLIFRFLINPDMSKFKSLDLESLKSKHPITKKEKYILAVYLAVVAVWMLPGILSMLNIGESVKKYINGFGLVLPAYAGIILMSIIRVDRQPLLELKKAAKEGVAWHIVFLVAGNMLIANALSNKAVGFSAWFELTVKPLIANASPLAFVLFIAFFTVVLTNLGSNTVAAVISFQLAALLLPQGMNLAVLAVIVAFACRAAFCLPSSFVGIGTIYGEEWANTKKILPYGLIMSLGSVLLLTLVGYPLGLMLF